MPTPGPQTDAYHSEADILFYGGSAGGGKALAYDSPVLTPFGWKPIGELEPGCKVCATDGSVTQVIGVFPQGVKPLYRVTFQDGTEIEADLDHNWLGWPARKSRKIGNARLSGVSARAKYTTAEIKTILDDGGSFCVPLPDPVALNVAGQLKGKGRFVPRRIDPYLLGLLLGDGSLGNLCITSADEEIAAYLKAELGGDLSVYETGQAANGYYVRGDRWVEINAHLGELGLSGARSHEKFIPRQYLYAPTEERWALLQGLMDTDGTAEAHRACYYTTVSPGLSEGVEALARSLGAMVTTTTRTPTYDGGKRGKLAYTSRIKIKDPARLFRLSRKREIALGIQHQSLSKRVTSIEFSRDANAVCIAVRHPNSLYITAGYTVTHNTDLLIGLSLCEHKNAIIFRREGVQQKAIIRRFAEIFGSRDRYNAQDKVWRINPGHEVELGSCKDLGDEESYQGQPHDLKCFDELPHFTESQFRFLIGWLRSTDPDQRCRVVAAGNPPTDSDGDWIVDYWGPWLDPDHPNPAEPGELRWFTTDPETGKDMEVPSGDPIEVDGEMVKPLSRTFIPSSVEDNPFLMKTGYKSMLQALPEPLRSLMLEGKFGAGTEDDPWQTIPTKWVTDAQDRWQPTPPGPMDSLGVDVARGGRDQTVLSPRHQTWYGPLSAHPGAETPDGATVAALCLAQLKDAAPIHVDVIGVGASVYDHLEDNNLHVVGINGAERSKATDQTGKLSFKNKRSELYWKFRELLDPRNGHNLQLPPGNSLKRDLCAPRWKLTPSGIQVESKEDLVKRLGRSPDEGDAVIYASVETPKRTVYEVITIPKPYQH